MEKPADIVETTEMEALAFAPDEIMATDEMPFGELVIVEEPQASEGDYEKTQNLGDFMSWITKKMNTLPPHSGKTTAGCERVIAHLKMLDKEISRAISRDVDCKLDDQAVEKFRMEIRKMVKKLEKRHKEINDAYDADDEKFASSVISKEVKGSTCACQTKEAQAQEFPCTKCGRVFATKDALQTHLIAIHGESPVDDGEVKQSSDENCPTCKIKLWKAAEGLYECISCDAVIEKPITKAAHTAKLTLIMTPFERAITGAIVNGFVSQGKNPEEIYAALHKKYKFSERDELSIQQILYDMGYPILKDRGHIGDSSEQLNKGKGIEFSTQYDA